MRKKNLTYLSLDRLIMGATRHSQVTWPHCLKSITDLYKGSGHVSAIKWCFLLLFASYQRSNRLHNCWRSWNREAVSRKLRPFINSERSWNKRDWQEEHLTASTLQLFHPPAASPQDVWRNLRVSSDSQKLNGRFQTQAHDKRRSSSVITPILSSHPVNGGKTSKDRQEESLEFIFRCICGSKYEKGQYTNLALWRLKWFCHFTFHWIWLLIAA